MTSKRVMIGNSYGYILEDAIKKGIIDYLYKTINLANYRYNLLTAVHKLKYLQENEHYISPNFKGYNYLLIITTIYGMNYAVIIDRRKLSYHKQQIDYNNLQILKIKIDVSENIYNGTIFDGKLINNKSNYVFLIQDCLYLMNTYLTNMDMIEKLNYVKIIMNSQFNSTNGSHSCPNFEFKINKLQTYNDLEDIITNMNSLEYQSSGLVFFPKKSGTNIIFIDKKSSSVEYNTSMNDTIEAKAYDIILNYTEYLKSRKYSYEEEKKTKELWLIKTITADVYDVYELHHKHNIEQFNILSEGIKLGIALIPNLKISHLCDSIINDKPCKFQCVFSNKFKKWIPLKFIEN
jgi:hypothetical protein